MSDSFDGQEILRQMAELQHQLAFQEDTVHNLNEALAAQQKEILLLRRQLELLKQRQDEMGPSGEGASNENAVDERPPHY